MSACAHAHNFSHSHLWPPGFVFGRPSECAILKCLFSTTFFSLHYAPSFMTMIPNENKNNPSPPNVSYPWNLFPLEIGQNQRRNLGNLSVVSLLFSPQGRQGMKGRRHLRAVSLESPKQGLGGRVKNSARMWDLKSQSRSSRPLRTMRLDERGVMCNC